MPKRSAAQPVSGMTVAGARVCRHRPRDGGVGQRVAARGEDLLEGGQGDVDDGDVEDRHDRAEDDDAGDFEDGAIDLPVLMPRV